jgi:hypothetical protein
MAVAAAFGQRLLDHWIWLMGLWFMFEPAADSLFDKYRAWADRYISRHVRSRVSLAVAIFTAFVACFLAFQDQFNATVAANNSLNVIIGERDEARHQRDANASPAIDRLSGDLISARAQIDTLRRQIERQQTPRHLTPEQRAAIVDAISPFQGQKITLACSISSWDCTSFARDFQSAFKQAEWDTSDKITIGIAIGYDDAGIEVAVNPQTVTDPNKVPPSVRVLMETLFSLRLVPKLIIDRSSDVETGTIRFTIGRIPPDLADKEH